MERRLLEIEEWELRPVSVEHSRPGPAEALAIEPAQGILERVNDKGIILQIHETKEGLLAGVYFFPWSSVIHIRLME